MTRREQELTSQLAQCQQALLESRRENALLRQKVDLLVKRVFGSSSELLDRNQLELLTLPESAAAPPVAVVAPQKERAQRTGCAFAGEPAGGGGSHRSRTGPGAA